MIEKKRFSEAYFECIILYYSILCVYLNAMRMYNGIKTMQIIGEIRYTDAKSKGVGNPSLNDSDLLRELVFKILH